MKQLLVERVSTITVPKSTIVESIQKNDGKLIIRNVLLQRADTPNRNKRVYPKRVLERELENYSSKIRERRAFSELDHPESNVVNLKNVCQAIIDARWVGNEIRGDVEILNTPSGNIVKEILLAGFRVGQSSRGMGSVEPLKESGDEDMVEVQDDFELVTLADVVSDESTHDANMMLGENRIYSPQVDFNYKRANDLIRDIMCELGQQCCFK